MTYQFHPFANIFPLLDDADLGTLTEDIRENGQREPVILYDGKILDGRNRYRACVELGIPAFFDHSKASNDEEALRESVSRNLRRRHLTASQRAMIGADLLPMFEAIAQEKQAHGMTAPGQTLGAHGRQAFEGRAPKASAEAAEASESSPRQVERAKNIKADGVPELVSAVRAGDIAVRRAEEVSKLDEDTQREVVARVTAGEKASEVVREVKGDVPLAYTLSKSNEWYTPDLYIEAARDLMGGIDLDPASCEQANETVKAETFYTKEDDGFSKVWRGRVWMNPPYGVADGISNASRWSSKLIDSYSNGEVTSAVFILNAFTSASWFEPLFDHSICFARRRIRFISPTGKKDSPPHGNVIVYLGQDITGFVDHFSRFGRIVLSVPSLKNISVAKGD